MAIVAETERVEVIGMVPRGVMLHHRCYRAAHPLREELARKWISLGADGGRKGEVRSDNGERS